MPEFSPSESRTAKASIAVVPSGLSCSAELYLVSNTTKVVTSGIKTFTSTGAKQNISFPITMPGAAGTYPVWLDIYAQGMLIGAYEAIEDVVITPVAIAEFAYVSGVRHSRHMTIDCNAHRFEIDVKNVGNAAGVCSLVFHYRQRFETVDPPGVWFGWYAVTEPHYCYYTPMPCILEATLQPGETKTFLYDILISYVASHLQAYFTGDPGTSPTKKMRHTPRVHGGWWQE